MLKPSSSKNNKKPQHLINLIIKSQDGDKRFFQFNHDVEIKRLLIKYCETKSQPFKSTPFLINGNRFDYSKTADQLGLKDGDEIDAMYHAFGGGHDHRA
ncbi:hypothetical protein CUMW_211560 [Citrus unshiu]|uniref:Ubiquitin-like domain-containing protein n=2 Tax=Citrus sinensis TaxID=2711 RepID=A0A067E3T2_CITSI|nr:hypothetical protein CISIN_1g045424mg [Citrus sinensis]GAY61637.1 hypothetical protein CUMW_211560 [Citrus unshiu]